MKMKNKIKDNFENLFFFSSTLLLFDGDEIEPFWKKFRISVIELKFELNLFRVYFHTTKNGMNEKEIKIKNNVVTFDEEIFREQKDEFK